MSLNLRLYEYSSAKLSVFANFLVVLLFYFLFGKDM